MQVSIFPERVILVICKCRDKRHLGRVVTPWESEIQLEDIFGSAENIRFLQVNFEMLKGCEGHGGGWGT